MHRIICLLYPNCATLQGPGRSSFNTYLHHVANSNIAGSVELDLPVLRERLSRLWKEYQFVGAVASLQLLPFMCNVGVLDQYLFHLVEVLLVNFESDARLQFFHSMQPALFLCQRYVVFPTRG